jgi:archaellum component FlaC
MKPGCDMNRCDEHRSSDTEGLKPVYPVSGAINGNLFMVDDGIPFIFDSTMTTHGSKINCGDSIFTRINRRSDVSCLDISATVDMTDSPIKTNAVLRQYLLDVISLNNVNLDKVLPVFKSGIKIKLYYNILDMNGGVVESRTMECIPKSMKLHETNVADYFVTSLSSYMIADIPSMDYAGIYQIELTKLEAIVYSLNTKDYLDAGNPFYSWDQSLNKVNLNHAGIESAENPTSAVLIEKYLSYRQEFTGNVSTRFKFSFVTYLSNFIYTANNAYDIYAALYSTTEARIKALEDLVAQLSTTVTQQEDRITALENRVAILEIAPKVAVEYAEGVELHIGELTWEVVGKMYQATETFTASGDLDADVQAGKLIAIGGGDTSELETRVDTLETNVGTLDTSVETLETNVGTIETNVGALETSVGTLETTVNTVTETTLPAMQDEIDDIKDSTLGQYKLIVKNLDTKERQYVSYYSDAAQIIKNDTEHSYSITPGPNFSASEVSTEAFKDCTNLKYIEFPSNTSISIKSKAFQNTGITSLTLGRGVSSMQANAFSDCLDLTTVNIDNSNLSTNSEAFSGCTNLTDVTITSVYELGTSAFKNTGITTLTIPSSCNSLNTAALSNCPSLVTVVCNANKLNDYIFSGSSALQHVELGSNCTSLTSNSFTGTNGVSFDFKGHRSSSFKSGEPWGAVDGTFTYA